MSKKHQVGKGIPFFPDAIKSYNQGTDWVTEDYPFCPLDYLLAVEGALAMRGATLEDAQRTQSDSCRVRWADRYRIESAGNTKRRRETVHRGDDPVRASRALCPPAAVQEGR